MRKILMEKKGGWRGLGGKRRCGDIDWILGQEQFNAGTDGGEIRTRREEQIY